MSEHARTRREVLTLAATAGTAVMTSPGLAMGPQPQSDPGSFPNTRLGAVLGIEHPILQAPMAGVATPELVAAVSGAGGLGILPGTGVPAEELRRRIRATRALTSRPFGVNLLLHPAIRRPADPATIPAPTLAAVQAVLNRCRATLGLAASSAAPPPVPGLVDAAIEVVLEERVPVFSIGLGRPDPALVARFHERGARVVAMAATLPDALELASAGVDAIVAQGGEAGGHRSTWVKRAGADEAAIGTLVLVPQVARAVPVPVVAAGGISDGRGLLAALAAGASGILMGTRFIATAESGAPEAYKRALVAADSDSTAVTDAFTGLWARVLRNEYVEAFRRAGGPVLPPILQMAAAADVTAAATARADTRFLPLYAGQGVGLIDSVPSAAEVVATTLAEAREAMARLVTAFASA